MKTCPKCGASCNFEMRSKRKKPMSRDDLMKKHVKACKEAFKKIGMIS